MNLLSEYITSYIRHLDKWLFITVAAFVTLFVAINYKYQLESRVVMNLPSRFQRFMGLYSIYLIAFFVPYLLLYFFKKPNSVYPWQFWLMVFVAPAIFALKVAAGGWSNWVQQYIGGPQGKYIGIIINLPIRLCLVLGCLFIFQKIFALNPKINLGVQWQGFEWKPYLMMLLAMLPLIAFASTQTDFLHTYPKLKQINFILPHTNYGWLYKLIYEISYGIDFITIEIFFRGFLVLCFARFVGTDAILPMAVFYCSIHFGKPMLECISSFFGGLLLGIIVYNTKSIAGGLLVHLGIAWLMEAGGSIGALLFLKK